MFLIFCQYMYELEIGRYIKYSKMQDFLNIAILKWETHG